MLFNSYEFLVLFLPLVRLGYYVVLPKSWRLGFLTVASYIFYGWWDYRFCSLMFLTTVIDYVAALGIYRARTPAAKKGWMLLSVVSGLTLLGFFKYYGLFAQTGNALASWLHGAPVHPLPALDLILPIGISFYTFHSMSYAIDVYRGAVAPARNFINFACFVSLFTQLVAGPIIRYRDLTDQLLHRTHTLDKAARGVAFFVLGLVKKVIVADGVASLVPLVFGEPHPGLAEAWVGVLAYTVQIYFDFSGYSDMAVGLGYLFGFQIAQNFHSPYRAVSITDFWRRWHMSLSTWLRDYLYIPLGGSRLGVRRTYLNLFLTMLLGGLWHGANWTFVVWGAYHGLLLALERALGMSAAPGRLAAALRQALTFLLVMVGWVFFRCDTLPQALTLLGGLVGLNGVGLDLLRVHADGLALAMLPVGLLVAWFLPNTWELKYRFRWWECVLLAFALAVCVMVILINVSSPFLYFQF